jgi:A/G-specific adenine glycosylase
MTRGAHAVAWEAGRRVPTRRGISSVDRTRIVTRTLRWYDRAARDLPWRRPDASPWAIMVSEFMLQQTPVARVLQPWQEWMARWPSPTALADAPSGEAVRAWGRLGYPRRALRLHQAATAIRDDHDGVVPDDHDALLALPGVGSYTAAAIASFAFGRRHVVLDTNVRRVQTRVAHGLAYPHVSATAAERLLAEEFLPSKAERAARWAVASMELGALICTARSPRCDDCPVRTDCAWHAAGRPAWDGPPRVGQRYQGTDRPCRGALLAVLRSADDAVPGEDVLAAWSDRRQAERALDSLLSDGLIAQVDDSRLSLPG